jgi:hypothetical protein
LGLLRHTDAGAHERYPEVRHFGLCDLGGICAMGAFATVGGGS